MALSNLTGKKIGVIGTGQEGQAIARYLVSKGFSPEIFDQKAVEEWDSAYAQFVNEHQLATHTGESYLQQLVRMDVIFRSPGFPYLHPALAQAKAHGAIITSQTKWFFEHNPAVIFGVTGTKGKGTTSSLLHAMLSAHHAGTNKKVYLTGNIGKVQPLEFIDELRNEDIVVYELSSFQLQDNTTSPHIGICLMTTSDHLDYHVDLQEYHHAKESILKFQTAEDFGIYNTDYTASRMIGSLGNGKKFAVSGVTQPAQGAFIDGEMIALSGIEPETMLIDCSHRKLRGKHNLENIAAASMAALIWGVPAATITSAVNEFKGLEHRLEFVAAKNGISYYNDSIATTPDTAIAAVRSFTEPVIVIVGGSSKGVSMYELSDFLNNAPNIKAIALLGETGKEIAAALQQMKSSKRILGPSTSLSDTMHQITTLAEPGDAVLLSPAAASFDMFTGYVDRGNQFKALVTELP